MSRVNDPSYQSDLDRREVQFHQALENLKNQLKHERTLMAGGLTHEFCDTLKWMDMAEVSLNNAQNTLANDIPGRK